MKREVLPEILDGLSSHDPRAMRSRRDLQRINWLMGNSRWVVRQVAAMTEQISVRDVMELGAGDGSLLRLLRQRFRGLRLSGADLVDRPAGLDASVAWHSGDLFQREQGACPEVLICNLFLHHFSFSQIRELIQLFPAARCWLINEPHRVPLALTLGAGMSPFVNEVTRHDMAVSIRAGFLEGELEELFPATEWALEEQVDLRGAYRVTALRRAR